MVLAALVLSYAVASATAAGLRHNVPDLSRPLRVRAFGIIDPVSFVISTLVVFQSGWDTLLWLLGLRTVMLTVYVLCKSKVPVHTVSPAWQVKSFLRLITLHALIMLLSWLGSLGNTGVIGHPWSTVVIAVMLLGIYYRGERTCLSQVNLTSDEEG